MENRNAKTIAENMREHAFYYGFYSDDDSRELLELAGMLEEWEEAFDKADVLKRAAEFLDVKIDPIEDFQGTAAALYDGGWRADEKEEIMEEYGISSWEADQICEYLEEFAQ